MPKFSKQKEKNMSNPNMKELYKGDPGALMMMDGIEEIVLNAKISALDSILSLAAFEGYTMSDQITYAIKSDIALFKKMKLLVIIEEVIG